MPMPYSTYHFWSMKELSSRQIEYSVFNDKTTEMNCPCVVSKKTIEMGRRGKFSSYKLFLLHVIVLLWSLDLPGYKIFH